MSGPLRLLVFGLGYTGRRLAIAAKGEADWVGGTVRKLDEALSLDGQGIRTFIFDGTHAGVGVAEAIRQATHVVVSVPPGDGDPVLTCHRTSMAAADHLQWIGYLSTIGVYGDHGGSWVDETTEPSPGNPRSVARLQAEQAWQALAAERKVPIAVLRIAGIYGPGRNAFVQLAEGTAHRIVKAGQVFNRIHVDDLVGVISAAMRERAAGVFNVADDEPAPPEDVVAHAALLMGVPPPPAVPFATAELSAMARSFYSENKRVKNQRIKTELGVALSYRDYRAGLAALWRDGRWSSVSRNRNAISA